MLEPLTPAPGIPRRAPSRVGRAGVVGRGEELREHDGEHDLPRELRLRPAPALDPQRQSEERADIAPHLHQLCHSPRIPLVRHVRSATSCSPTRAQTASPAPG